jgi:hypothetical protein
LGFRWLLAGGVVLEKTKKRCAIRRVTNEGKNVGPEWSERLRERVLEAYACRDPIKPQKPYGGCARVTETGATALLTQ